MLLLRQENRGVVLFDDFLNLVTPNIIFVDANILIGVETEQNQHEIFRYLYVKIKKKYRTKYTKFY